jgi:hypothetical protein
LAQAAPRRSARSPGKKKQKKKHFFIFIFIFFAACRAQAASRRSLVGPPAWENFIYFILLNFFVSWQATLRIAAGPPAPTRKRPKKKNFYFYFRHAGLIPPTSMGLTHGSPPTSYLLTPTSYLYYYIRLLMSLISLFFFALTFGKPLNYFTCKKEDF